MTMTHTNCSKEIYYTCTPQKKRSRVRINLPESEKVELEVIANCFSFSRWFRFYCFLYSNSTYVCLMSINYQLGIISVFFLMLTLINVC